MYQADQGDEHFELGTSGFLYRSNKLMYDKDTNSLWNTIQGKPVVGPLVARDIELERHPVITSDWKTWKSQHPDTLVLSLETGFNRDYGEGVAYAEYFSHDQLMFDVPIPTKKVLKNKAQVFAMRSGDAQLAIASDFLAKKPVYHGELDGQKFVVLTDPGGANRAFACGEHQFESFDGDKSAKDVNGVQWNVSEPQMENSEGEIIKRIPAHRSFWFGWLAQYPDTQLIK